MLKNERMINDQLISDRQISDKLIDAIGMIDEDMVKDAREFGRGARKKTTGKMPARRIMAMAAAIALCFFISVPALAAAEVETAQNLLYTVAPSIAQRLKPVRKSCVDNGIQMEVVSAKISGDTAEVYIAMKDLEGDRIDGTMDLFDSYDIRNAYDCTATCDLDSYDEETGVATFLILIRQTDGKKISGDKVTFTVSEFMSHKKEFKGMIYDDLLSAADRTPETVKDVSIRGCSMRESSISEDEDVFGKGEKEPDEEVYLKPKSQTLNAPVKGAEISAAGYINGKLHVQMYYEDILNTDNHGWLWLEKPDGSRVECEGTVSFWDEEDVGAYEEYVFDIPYEDLKNYELYGELTVCDTLTEGDWQVTFPMDSVQEK